MAKCKICDKHIGFLEQSYHDSKAKGAICETCAVVRIKEISAKAPKIKCPFCEQWFPKLTNEQYRDSAELNVLKYAVAPAWGLAGSLKNKPFIQCPHCGMKIMQG